MVPAYRLRNYSVFFRSPLNTFPAGAKIIVSEELFQNENALQSKVYKVGNVFCDSI